MQSLLDNEPETVWLALQAGNVIGFVGFRFQPEDQMGEIYIPAISLGRQRQGQGIGRALMDFPERKILDCGMKMVMVETVGDTGHEPARRFYKRFSYRQWPVACCFKPL